jgi:hypothetical protein
LDPSPEPSEWGGEEMGEGERTKRTIEGLETGKPFRDE